MFDRYFLPPCHLFSSPQSTDRNIICAQKDCTQRGKPGITVQALVLRLKNSSSELVWQTQAERKRSKRRGVTERCNGAPGGQEVSPAQRD
ncbi:hypothetical protein EYF80_067858 [Liparis tanakae]|uniref:Uncharacterized protein n=1 Tax=Liparis tanakae TaxID=230148 RepID=A0A4Z2DZX8_9TELE|nr:hypothetical protein EYF80_067858 [Liparis tanakae]